jgi:hypothetical protein
MSPNNSALDSGSGSTGIGYRFFFVPRAPILHYSCTEIN